MKVAELFNEGLKDFGQKLLNKAVGVPSGEHKYKVGDTVKFEMIPGQEGGSDTGKIEKLLKGHHYLINGKPVNQNEIKSKVTESKKSTDLLEGTLASAWKKIGDNDGEKHYKHKTLGHEIKIGKSYQAYAQSNGPAIRTSYQDLSYKKAGSDEWTNWGEVKNGVSDAVVNRALGINAELAKKLAKMKARRSEILDKMDRIVQDGGRVPLNDPLSVELRQLKRDIIATKTLTEAFAMDDIAVVSDAEHAKTNGGGGTVIYKTLKGYYKISKVRKKREPYTLLLWNGDTITNDAVVSTDYSDWKDYKDKKIVKENRNNAPRENIPQYAVCLTSDGAVYKDDVYMGDREDCQDYIARHRPPKGSKFDLMDVDSGRLVSYAVRKKVREERVDELKLGTLASYRQKRLQQRQEIMSKEPYAVPKGPKDPLSQKVHSGITRAYYKGLAKKAEEENERDPDRNSIQRQYYSGKSGSYTGD